MVTFLRAGASLAIACLLPSLANASVEAITEEEAIRLFLAESPQARVVPLAERSAGAALLADALMPNPSVGYEVEDTPGARDEFLIFEQELPLIGRRGLLRKRAEVASSAAKLAAERKLELEAYEVKLSFYELLYREEALGLLRGGVRSLERTVAILREREKEGESSGYDLLRAEQELAELRIAESEAESAQAAVRSRFASFFDASHNVSALPLSGDFSTVAPAVEDPVGLALAHRSDLRSLVVESERLELEWKAARRQRLPQPALMAGWKRTEALDLSEDGFVAGLTLSLPLFNRGQHPVAQAAAGRELVELEREILEREIRAEVHAALARERAAEQRSRLYGREAETRAADLRRIAQLSYDEGESGILELLDAHRTSLSMELSALEARYEAKRAAIELDRVIGIEVMP